MALYVYVDNSNVWLEGQRVSAVAKGMAVNIYAAMNDKITDPSWSYDFGQLYRLACPETEKLGRTALFGSRPPANDSLWTWARTEGFEVFVHDRNRSNKEKKLDMDIGTMMVDDSWRYMHPGSDAVVLLAGDGDYIPAFDRLHARGIEVRVMFWDQCSKELRETADQFISLNPYLDHLARTIQGRDS